MPGPMKSKNSQPQLDSPPKGRGVVRDERGQDQPATKEDPVEILGDAHFLAD